MKRYKLKESYKNFYLGLALTALLLLTAHLDYIWTLQ